jgi:hypothetical protein
MAAQKSSTGKRNATSAGIGTNQYAQRGRAKAKIDPERAVGLIDQVTGSPQQLFVVRGDEDLAFTVPAGRHIFADTTENEDICDEREPCYGDWMVLSSATTAKLLTAPQVTLDNEGMSFEDDFQLMRDGKRMEVEDVFRTLDELGEIKLMTKKGVAPPNCSKPRSIKLDNSDYWAAAYVTTSKTSGKQYAIMEGQI